MAMSASSSKRVQLRGYCLDAPRTAASIAQYSMTTKPSAGSGLLVQAAFASTLVQYNLRYGRRHPPERPQGEEQSQAGERRAKEERSSRHMESVPRRGRVTKDAGRGDGSDDRSQ